MPQVLMLFADPILDGLYRNRIQAPDFVLVWGEPGEPSWKAALKSFPYDVVVADLSFFRTEDLSAALHELVEAAPESEVVVLTDSEDVRLAIAAFHLGVSDYFLKPVNPETLIWAIEKAVHKRSLRSSSETLSEDLKLFNVLHQLGVAETDAKMRGVAAKYLMALLGARGAVWLLPNAEGPGKGPPEYEFFGTTKEEGQAGLLDFLEHHPSRIEGSFSSHLTNHPEEWVLGQWAWIPLHSPWMGGVFLFGVKGELNPTLQARLEFLVRKLEVSLENHDRYVKARQLTFIDDLTGLYNSRYLEVAVSAAVDRYRKSRSGFSILFVDVDRFKGVNDTHGHLVGSRLLVEMASLLKGRIRKPDHLFRYGGDEFIALLYDTGLEEARQTAERLRAEVERHHFLIQKKAITVTLSIGVARFPDHGTDKAQVIQLADEAMYESKKAGRNSVFLAASGKPAKKAA